MPRSSKIKSSYHARALIYSVLSSNGNISSIIVLKFVIFTVISWIYFSADNYLHICNRQTYSMTLNIIAALLNILLDFLLIVVFDACVLGAALASCISMAIGSFFSLLPFFRKKLELRFISGKIPAKQFLYWQMVLQNFSVIFQAPLWHLFLILF